MIEETMLIRMALRNVEKEVMASGKLNCNEDMGGVKGDFSTVCDFPPIPAVESLSAKWSQVRETLSYVPVMCTREESGMRNCRSQPSR